MSLTAAYSEECLFLLGMSFTDFAAEARAHLPGSMSWLMDTDMVPAYPTWTRC